MVRDGQIVRPSGPRSWTPTTKSSDEAAQKIAAGGLDAPAPYIYDVDGVESRVAQFQFYQRLEQAHAAPWIHAGCRTPEDAMDTFFAGAEAITVELRHMPEDTIAELAGLAEGEIHLGAALDATMPRPRELARIVQAHGLAGVVLQSAASDEARRLESAAMELRTLGVEATLLRLGAAPVPHNVEPQLARIVESPSG
jgi:hypothetical protein